MRAEALEEIIRKIKEVNVKSLEFHLFGDDFQIWTDENLEDKELAAKIRSLQILKPVETLYETKIASLPQNDLKG